MEKLEIVLPKGVTRQDVFSLVASSNKSEPILRTQRVEEIVYNKDEITDEILEQAKQEGNQIERNAQEEVVWVRIKKIITDEKENPESLEDFAKRNIKEQLLNMINWAKARLAEEAVKEQIETIKTQAIWTPIEGGEVL